MISLTGCASSPHGRLGDRNVITAEQILSANVETAYDLVVKFRPNFLAPRGPTSILLKQSKEPSVYVDNVEFGLVASLRTIQASSLSAIRFVEGREAMTKYGADHSAGVIELYTRYR